VGRLWRVQHDPIAGLPDGERVTLCDAEAHHVQRVLRLRVGQPIALFDGRDVERTGEIVHCERRRVEVALGPPIDVPVEPPLTIVLYQALCRPERLDWLLQKGTEVGVSEFRLLRLGRSGEGRAGESRQPRWERIVLEACKQSGRRRLPEISLLDAETALLRETGPRLLLDPSAECGLERAVAALEAPVSRCAIAVGPENGFNSEENANWRAAGWTPVGLGPRILRTETAGIVASSLLLFLLGDLRG